MHPVATLEVHVLYIRVISSQTFNARAVYSCQDGLIMDKMECVVLLERSYSNEDYALQFLEALV